jgi:hypothetical protein
MSIYIAGTSFRATPPNSFTLLTCDTDGCGGIIVRHSLGCGLSVHRCTRCFRRYEAGSTPPAQRGSLSRVLHEFLTWREED